MDGEASWDQFEVNERLYGVRTSFDELLYTTPLPNQPKLWKRAEAVQRRMPLAAGRWPQAVHRLQTANRQL